MLLEVPPVPGRSSHAPAFSFVWLTSCADEKGKGKANYLTFYLQKSCR
jgi:hypothetical protein